MSYVLTGRLRGFGATGQQYVSTGQSVAGAGVALASATGTLAPVAAALGVSVPVVGAIIGAGILAAGLAIDAIMNSGCGQTCIQSTSFANQANAALQKNIEAYFALPAPRPKSAQTAALAQFDTFWKWLVQQCSAASLGNAGVRCISDRQAGACTWKQPASSVPPWGVPPAGSCWNWFNGYRDPIANDPNVYDDSASLLSTAAGSAGAAVNSISSDVAGILGGSSAGGSLWPLALVAGLVAVAVLS